jgi:thioredoxin 1
MEINSVELQEKINSGDKIILKLGAPWCGPCRMMDPVFEKIAKENTSDVQMYTMNVDLNKEASIALGVRSIPTIKIFNAGQLIETKVGMLSEGQINGLVTGLING